MKKCLLLIVVLCMILTGVCTVFAEGDDVLRVGICVSPNPPRAYYEGGDPANGLVGVEPELLTEIAKCMGREVEFYDVAWSGLFTGLLSEKWDVAASAIFITADRLEMMDFADPYVDNDLAFLVRVDNPITTYEDLKGKVLCCDTGAGSEKWLREHMDEYGPYTIQTYNGASDIWPDVMTGRCDGGLGDSPNIEFYSKQYPDQVRPGLYLGMGYKAAFSFRPGDPMIPEFNECQRELKKNGFLPELYEKYYGTPAQEGTAVYDLYETPYVLPEGK